MRRISGIKDIKRLSIKPSFNPPCFLRIYFQNKQNDLVIDNQIRLGNFFFGTVFSSLLGNKVENIIVWAGFQQGKRKMLAFYWTDRANAGKGALECSNLATPQFELGSEKFLFNLLMSALWRSIKEKRAPPSHRRVGSLEEARSAVSMLIAISTIVASAKSYEMEVLTWTLY